MIIFLHSSKTMQQNSGVSAPIQMPGLSHEAGLLATYLKSLSKEQIAKSMALSPAMAEKTYELIQGWDDTHPTLPALDIFLGDIYSGLQVQSFSKEDRNYANEHLYILSGLYGVLRALDTIQPYRLEMGYKFPGNAHSSGQLDLTSLYEFWGDAIARQLPKNQAIINLSAVEYTKAVLPHLKNIDGFEETPVITPRFLTVSPKTKEPIFVTVHAKIARGAFARWLIQNRIEDPRRLQEFSDLGYTYDASLSTAKEPVFVAKEFKGIGLSVRLT